MPGRNAPFPPRVNVSGRYRKMAAFQTSTNGRFWVSTEARPGSRTLRHTCVQRLVDAGWPLKSIGDYVGHRSPASTEIYSKVAIETLREVACGNGDEEVV